jgi:hypothetical protein
MGQPTGQKTGAVLAWTVAVLASASLAEASPFLINVVQSSGGGGRRSSTASIPSVDGFSGIGSFGMLSLGLKAKPNSSAKNGTGATIAPVGDSQGTGSSFITPKRFVAPPFIEPTGASLLNGTVVSSPIANLDLGNDDYISVSSNVVGSLLNPPPAFLGSSGSGSPALGPDAPTRLTDPATGTVVNDITNGKGTNSVGNGVSTNGNGTSDGGGANEEILNSVIPDVAAGLISSPGDTTNPLFASSFVSLGPLAPPADPAPEPGSLALLGSGLVLSAATLRGRKSGLFRWLTRKRPAGA